MLYRDIDRKEITYESDLCGFQITNECDLGGFPYRREMNTTAARRGSFILNANLVESYEKSCGHRIRWSLFEFLLNDNATIKFGGFSMEIRRVNFLWWNNGIKLISMENRRLNLLWWNNGIKWLSMDIRRLNFLWWNNGIKWLCVEFWRLIFIWWNNGVKWLCGKSWRLIFYGEIMEIRDCAKWVTSRAIEVIAPREKTPHNHPYLTTHSRHSYKSPCILQGSHNSL